jgi:hypothetical protein
MRWPLAVIPPAWTAAAAANKSGSVAKEKGELVAPLFSRYCFLRSSVLRQCSF